MENGTVINLFAEKGFGFVRDKFGAEHFAHATRCENFAALRVGDRVAFDFGTGRNGRTCAINVRPL